MPYPTLPASRRRHYEIDGAIVGYNVNGGFAAGPSTFFTSANMLALNEESPSVNTQVFNSGANGVNLYVYFFFPELTDLAFFTARAFSNGSLSMASALQSSVDTTNGADGTWLTVGSSGTQLYSNTAGGDWWRSNSPATLSTNNSGVKAVRFQILGTSSLFVYNVYLWGHKTSGQTPNDIIFLAPGTPNTEWTTDDDWGDLNAGSAAVTHTYYVKNTAASLTANTITVKSSGSDNGQWTVSLDNSSFASSKSISSLAAGASQVVYFKFTPPAATGGNIRPWAAYLEADVTSWT